MIAEVNKYLAVHPRMFMLAKSIALTGFCLGLTSQRFTSMHSLKYEFDAISFALRHVDIFATMLLAFAAIFCFMGFAKFASSKIADTSPVGIIGFCILIGFLALWMAPLGLRFLTNSELGVAIESCMLLVAAMVFFAYLLVHFLVPAVQKMLNQEHQKVLGSVFLYGFIGAAVAFLLVRPAEEASLYGAVELSIYEIDSQLPKMNSEDMRNALAKVNNAIDRANSNYVVIDAKKVASERIHGLVSPQCEVEVSQVANRMAGFYLVDSHKWVFERTADQADRCLVDAYLQADKIKFNIALLKSLCGRRGVSC